MGWHFSPNATLMSVGAKFHISHQIAYLTQHRDVVDLIAVRKRPHESIAETRFAHTSLSFVLFDSAQAHHGDIDIYRSHLFWPSKQPFVWNLRIERVVQFRQTHITREGGERMGGRKENEKNDFPHWIFHSIGEEEMSIIKQLSGRVSQECDLHHSEEKTLQ